MMSDFHEGDQDTAVLWTKDFLPVYLSGLSRFRRWLFPGLTVIVLLILIIVLGTTSVKTSNRMWSVEQRVSNMSSIIQSLNTSLQHAQDAENEVKRMRFAVESNKDQLRTMSDALKQLSVLDSLSRSVAQLRCSLHQIANNRSQVDSCCPLGWEQLQLTCFFFNRAELNWTEARSWCEAQQAHLVILRSDDTWDFVTRRTAPYFFWVGLSDWRTGHWEWVNHTPYIMERRRWRPAQPDNWRGTEDCAHLHMDGHLNDLHCSTRMRSVCQKPSLRI